MNPVCSMTNLPARILRGKILKALPARAHAE